jgi:hypothetical protein
MRARLARVCGCGAALLAVVLVFEGRLSAGGPTTVPVPEIDGLTLGSGLGVLAAGYLIVKAWRGSR